jgi:integrase
VPKYQKKERADGSIVYRYQYTDPTTGQRGSISAPSVAELEILRRKLGEARAAVGAGIEPSSVGIVLPGRIDPRRVTVGQVWDQYLAGQAPRARAKAESYARRNLNLPARRLDASMRPLFDLALPELTGSVMESWCTGARATGGRTGSGRSWSTIATAYDLLAAAVRQVTDGPTPWGRWRPQRGKPEAVERPAVGSWEEARAIIAAAAAEDARTGARGRYVDAAPRVVVAIAAGLRNAELAGLAWDDLSDLDRQPVILHVRHQARKGWDRWDPGPRPLAPPKGKRGTRRTRRQILEYIAADVLRAVRDEQRRRGFWRPDGPVFGVVDAGAWRWRTSGYAIEPEQMRRWAAAAGLPEPERWVTHCLRHSLATLLAAATGDARVVQERLGHADLKTSLGYWHRLGRGLAPPALSAELGAAPRVSLLTRGEAVTVSSGAPPLPGLKEPDPWGITPPPELPPSIELVTEAAIGAARVRRRRAAPAAAEPWSVVADRWLVEPERGANGQTLPRPFVVTSQARRAAVLAYAKAKRAGDRNPRDAWGKSYRAALARWARELSDARRRRVIAAASPADE